MIDWENLARRLGAILPSTDPSVSVQHGSSVLARRALEDVVDGAEWAAAVDHYVDRRPGSELARAVLWLVLPWAAMVRCRDIAQTSTDPQTRRFAVGCCVQPKRSLTTERGGQVQTEDIADGQVRGFLRFGRGRMSRWRMRPGS